MKIWLHQHFKTNREKQRIDNQTCPRTTSMPRNGTRRMIRYDEEHSHTHTSSPHLHMNITSDQEPQCLMSHIQLIKSYRKLNLFPDNTPQCTHIPTTKHRQTWNTPVCREVARFPARKTDVPAPLVAVPRRAVMIGLVAGPTSPWPARACNCARLSGASTAPLPTVRDFPGLR